MNDGSRDRRARMAGPAIAFLLGLFVMIFLGALTAAPARAATSSGLASCPALHLKSSGWCVKLLQRDLDNDQVSPYLNVDGHFGQQTSRAVKSFQREMKLPADGIAGPK
ncbi:MAG: peptidoglycan-binding domain-containing protein, partial [Mycobacterium sp.]